MEFGLEDLERMEGRIEQRFDKAIERLHRDLAVTITENRASTQVHFDAIHVRLDRDRREQAESMGAMRDTLGGMGERIIKVELRQEQFEARRIEEELAREATATRVSRIERAHREAVVSGARAAGFAEGRWKILAGLGVALGTAGGWLFAHWAEVKTWARALFAARP